MFGNRLNIDMSIGRYARKRLSEGDSLALLDGKLFVYGRFFRDMKEITAEGSAIDVTEQQFHDVEKLARYPLEEKWIMYYNSLVDTMYNVFEWLMRQNGFKKAYLTLDKRIIIKYKDRWHRWFIVEEALGYRVYARMNINEHIGWSTSHGIVVNGFNLFRNQPQESVTDIDNIDEVFENILRDCCSVMYVNGDHITAKDIKMKLTDGGIERKKSYGLSDVAIVTTD